jgi:hypothetical protein
LVKRHRKPHQGGSGLAFRDEELVNVVNDQGGDQNKAKNERDTAHGVRLRPTKMLRDAPATASN